MSQHGSGRSLMLDDNIQVRCKSRENASDVVSRLLHPRSGSGKQLCCQSHQYYRERDLNESSEPSIKPFVIGRKNWLFANTPRGAKASATIYSVIETAKENGLRPYNDLNYLFEQLPQLSGPLDAEVLESFLPWSASLPADCRMKQNP